MMSHKTAFVRGAIVTAMALLFQVIGCASNVPGGNGLSALSGKSLQVTLTFRNAVNPNYYYYFLINASNSASAPGPIPVGAPISGTTYGNGFATGSDAVSGGFTDFVLFSSHQYAGASPANGFALYHVMDGTNANAGRFVANGVPIQFVSPLTGGGNTIYFQIDLAQLFTYPNSPNTQAAAISMAKALRWVQVNMVATNIVPVDITSPVIKLYDSFGNDADGVGNFQLMDLFTQTAYVNGDPVLSATTTEPATDDVFISPPGSPAVQDPSLDLINWQIQIVTTS